MDDKHIKLKDAIDIVRNTVAEGTLESTLELRLLDKSLTADVVEVVRCKDCKFIRCGGNERNGILYFCSQDCKAKKSRDYCSYGERADT